MSKPKIDDLATASQSREARQYRTQRGAATVGWYRGEQSSRFEVYKLLMKWGNTRVAARLLKHYGMDKKGNVPLGGIE